MESSKIADAYDRVVKAFPGPVGLVFQSDNEGVFACVTRRGGDMRRQKAAARDNCQAALCHVTRESQALPFLSPGRRGKSTIAFSGDEVENLDDLLAIGILLSDRGGIVTD